MGSKGQQMLRQLKLVAEMKKGNFPNTQTLARILEAAEGDPGAPMGCSARTILRDIQQLQQEYNAPIEYDPANKGYYLRNPGWILQCPVFEEDFVSMSMLGTRLAQDLVPEPLRTDIDNAITQTLASSSSDFFDAAMIDSILCASGVKTDIDASIFKALFDAWRRKQAVILTYRDTRGAVAEHEFEPHILAFHKGIWYLKGYAYGTRDIRLYACQRVLAVRGNGHRFDIDRKILEDTRRNGLFNYPKVAGIRLHCDASIAFYIHEQQKVFHSVIDPQPDGSLILALNPTVEHEVVRWILAEAGRIQVLEPPSLRKKIAAAGREIARRNS